MSNKLLLFSQQLFYGYQILGCHSTRWADLGAVGNCIFCHVYTRSEGTRGSTTPMLHLARPPLLVPLARPCRAAAMSSASALQGAPLGEW